MNLKLLYTICLLSPGKPRGLIQRVWITRIPSNVLSEVYIFFYFQPYFKVPSLILPHISLHFHFFQTPAVPKLFVCTKTKSTMGTHLG